MNSSCKKAEVVEVIKVTTITGNGKEKPFKEVTQYWTKDGNLISDK
ncbi:hypothetical protein GCM10007971_38720 [Oceanobacillus indicireducens]|uniref:Uncharacterized protein n=1 Tax=Oceanobacillus indicireducens TaxID=1004261 RepID=A0A917Y5P3_9BACI|nr:hypothetical protein GCM10007971_38720 [Oceanobacillus indicireducens]